MGDRIRVLLVDDDVDAADSTATHLERESSRITVVQERNSSDGLDVLAAERIDCIVSEYGIPGMNGTEFLGTVRKVEPELPFILFTGNGSEETASEAISIGVSDYLRNVGGSERYGILANRIETAVAKYRAEAEASEATRADTADVSSHHGRLLRHR